jgi:arylsulfatase A-like enzyme/uncharacterized Ntn-hydrolase superfamily protein
VIFLFADDQRADTVGALGNPNIKTPHLDTLAKSGMVFRNAYCLGSNQPAVCTPSRNMLLSGRTFFRWQGNQAPPEGPSFPTAMTAAGYETYHHGKRGNTSPAIQALFDHDKYVNDQEDRTSGEPGKTIVDAAIAFLKERKSGKPVFMYLAFSNPHDPRVAADKYLAKYERDKIPLPKNFQPLHPFNNGEQFVRDELLAGFPRTEDEVRQHLHEYYATITALDHHIGRLLSATKELGIYDNTIFVYSADHGLAIGSHGLFGKQNLYEDGMKPPLIFSGAGIPQGDTNALVYLHDIFPTVCDLVGAGVPKELDGKSLKGVIDSRVTGVRESLFLAYRDVQRAIRDSRYKLIRYPQVNVTQLFDLQEDPDELMNLATRPEHADRIKSLTAELERWQKDLGDKAPLIVENPQDPSWDPSKRPDPPAKSKKKKTALVVPAAEPEITATFSIVAADPETGVCGAAVASKYPAVGKVVPYVRPGVGAFCTQHYHVPKWGEPALDLLAEGKRPEEVLLHFLKDDPQAEMRQLAIIDMQGRVANHNPSTAPENSRYWGSQSGRYFSCQGNTLAGRKVISEMARAYEETKGTLADRLMAALVAGDEAGGDHRGRLAAGIRVAKKDVEGRWLELYVDESDGAVAELAKKYSEIQHEAKGE